MEKMRITELVHGINGHTQRLNSNKILKNTLQVVPTQQDKLYTYIGFLIKDNTDQAHTLSSCTAFYMIKRSYANYYVFMSLQRNKNTQSLLTNLLLKRTVYMIRKVLFSP